MKEHPILFSGPMVRAILAGTKTQTRRVAKEFRDDQAEILRRFPNQHGCPFGEVGDRLWVRETWAYATNVNEDPDWPNRPHLKVDPESDYQVVIYRADGSIQWCDEDGFSTERSYWKSPIFMPRALSRITLEITDVRVERLQAISEADARAEGITDGGCLSCGMPEPCGCARPQPDPRESYIRLWDSLNEKRGLGWDTNPFVWVLTFRRVDHA